MILGRSTILRILRSLGLLVLLVIIITYATYRSINYFRGPEIVINSPEDGANIIITNTVNMATTTISGQIIRAKDLYINGLLTSIDENGNFDQEYLIFPGINRFTIEAFDQFERNTKKSLTLVGVAE